MMMHFIEFWAEAPRFLKAADVMPVKRFKGFSERIYFQDKSTCGTEHNHLWHKEI